jgi:DNA-binding FadR family transcriptional regulator
MPDGAGRVGLDTSPSNVLHLRFMCPHPRTSKSAAALHALRARLTDGTWPVGTRIPGEHELAAELGVGRNTLREALRTLTNQGLLAARAGDGTYVMATDELVAALSRRVTPAESLHALEVRGALEMQAARSAAQRITDADLARLGGLNEARRAAALADDDAAFVRADLAWHELIVAACGNPLLTEFYAGLDRVSAYVREPTTGDATRATPRLHRPAQDMDAAHQGVLDALTARDPDAALAAAAHLTDIAASHLLEASA